MEISTTWCWTDTPKQPCDWQHPLKAHLFFNSATSDCAVSRSLATPAVFMLSCFRVLAYPSSQFLPHPSRYAAGFSHTIIHPNMLRENVVLFRLQVDHWVLGVLPSMKGISSCAQKDQVGHLSAASGSIQRAWLTSVPMTHFQSCCWMRLVLAWVNSPVNGCHNIVVVLAPSVIRSRSFGPIVGHVISPWFNRWGQSVLYRNISRTQYHYDSLGRIERRYLN